VIAALGPTIVHAQQPSAGISELTAAFLVNFVKFTEWPGDDLAAPLLLCTSDAAVARAASDQIGRRPAGARPVQVQRVDLDPAPGHCAVLYVSGLDKKRVALLTSGLNGTSVLTVGDSADFARQGGVIHLYLEGDTMRFEINVAAAARANLRLSSKLLSLAVILKK
jgi:hypothetical protein